MKKLEYLKFILNNLNVSKEHLNYFDYILKEAGIDAIPQSDRYSKTKSLVFGPSEQTGAQNQDLSKEESSQDQQTQTHEEKLPESNVSTEEKTTDSNSKKEEVDRPSDDTPDTPEPIKIDCGGTYIAIDKIYNFKENKFLSEVNCDRKKCFLKYVIDLVKEGKDIFIFMDFISICKKYYKESLTDQEFDDLSDKIINSGNLEGFLDIQRKYISNENKFFSNTKYSKDFNYYYKYKFFNFINKDMDKVIDAMFSVKITKNSNDMHINSFIKYYNNNSKLLFGDCFKFNKFKTGFKNVGYFENQAEQIVAQREDIENITIASKDKVSKYEYQTKMFDDLKGMVKNKSYADRKYSEDYAKEIKKAKKGKGVHYIDDCGLLRVKDNYKKDFSGEVTPYEKNLSEYYKELDKSTVRSSGLHDPSFSITKEMALYSLYILSEKNEIPIEFTQIQYAINQFKGADGKPISITTGVTRTSDTSQSMCVKAMIDFSKKYSLSDIKNPYNFYKKPLGKSKYEKRILKSVNEYEIKNENDKPISNGREHAKNQLIVIRDFHELLEKSISGYEKESSEAGRSSDMSDFFKKLFANKNKILLNNNIMEKAKLSLDSSSKFNLLIKDLVFGEQGTDFYSSKEVTKFVPNGSAHRLSDAQVAKGIGRNHLYLSKDDVKRMSSSGEAKEKGNIFTGSRLEVTIDGRKWVKQKSYSGTGKFLAKDYYEDLKKLLHTISLSECQNATCGFDSNSEVFQTVCDALNDSTKVNTLKDTGADIVINDEAVSPIIKNLLFDSYIAKIKQNRGKYSNFSKDKNSIFYKIYKMIEKTYPSKEKIQSVNVENRGKYAKELVELSTFLTTTNLKPEIGVSPLRYDNISSYSECGKNVIDIYKDEIYPDVILNIDSLESINDDKGKAKANRIIVQLFDTLIRLLEEKKNKLR